MEIKIGGITFVFSESFGISDIEKREAIITEQLARIIITSCLG